MNSKTRFLQFLNIRFNRLAIYNLILQIFGLILQFIVAIAMARLLGAAGYGTYVYAFTWAMLIGMVLPLGLGRVQIRDIPLLVKQRNYPQINGLFYFALAITVFNGLIAAWAIFSFQAEIRLSAQVQVAFVILGSFLFALINLMASTNAAFQRLVLPQFAANFVRPVLFGLALTFLWLINSVGIETILQTFLICTLVGLLPLAWYAVRDLAAFPSPGGLRLRAGDWLRSSVPLLFVSATYLLNTNIDIVLVGILRTDEEVGIYRAATRGASLIAVALVVVNQVLTPMLAKAFAHEDADEVRRLLNNSAIFLSLAGMLGTAVLFIGAWYFLSLFGPAFVEGATALRVLSVGQCINVLTGSVGIILMLKHKERMLLLLNALSVIMNLGLNLVLIEPYGINGAAIATASSTILMNVMLLFYVVTKTDLDPTIFTTLRQRPVAREAQKE